MPLSLLNHSAIALFVQRTRIPTSARSIGFCASVPFGFVLVRVRVLSEVFDPATRHSNSNVTPLHFKYESSIGSTSLLRL